MNLWWGRRSLIFIYVWNFELHQKLMFVESTRSWYVVDSEGKVHQNVFNSLPSFLCFELNFLTRQRCRSTRTLVKQTLCKFKPAATLKDEYWLWRQHVKNCNHFFLNAFKLLRLRFDHSIIFIFFSFHFFRRELDFTLIFFTLSSVCWCTWHTLATNFLNSSSWARKSYLTKKLSIDFAEKFI